MVRHIYVQEGAAPPEPAGALYRYLTGRNGTFLQAAPPEIAVRIGVYGQFLRLPHEWIFRKTAFEQRQRSRFLEPF